MRGPAWITWIGVGLAAAALCAAVVAVARVGRLPDLRRYVLDAAGRRVEIRHA